MALWSFLTEDDRVLRQYHKSARTANKKPLRGSYKMNKNKIINYIDVNTNLCVVIYICLQHKFISFSLGT